MRGTGIEPAQALSHCLSSLSLERGERETKQFRT